MFAAATVAVLLLFGVTSADAKKKIVKRGIPAIYDDPQRRSVSKTSACGIDLMLIVDQSQEIDNDTFEKERQFVLTILDGLTIGPDATRVGIMKYSGWGYLQTDQFTSSKNDAVKAAKDMDQCNGATNTYQGLEKAQDSFHNHARSENLGIPRVTVLIGSGWSDDPDVALNQGVRDLKAEGVTLFTVGINGYRNSNDAHLRDLGNHRLLPMPNVFCRRFDRFDSIFYHCTYRQQRLPATKHEELAKLRERLEWSEQKEQQLREQLEALAPIPTS